MHNSIRGAKSDLQVLLPKAATLQITPHIASVTVNTVVMTPLLFKLIIHLATIDSKAMPKVLCKNLQTLDSYMTTFGSNINKFHLYFYTNYNQLVGRGEHVDDHSHCFGMGTRCVLTVHSGSTWSPRRKISLKDETTSRTSTMKDSSRWLPTSTTSSRSLGSREQSHWKKRKLWPSLQN